MRVVLDANVLISAVISPRGNPAQILRLWEWEEFELVVSLPTLEELERVIHYPRIQERYNLSEEDIEQFLQLIGASATVVEPSVELTVIEKDRSDNRYLECALAAGASYIVTGDDHLLSLKEYRGVVILNPAGFLTLLGIT
ncbi:MAG: putative toxin-antitoxin system toxin component, PIN family [Anaerolineae bacterium]|nr:putative toxin-antitoxin system toxin component, PIN family [Anaerolineae bacterium]